MKRIHGFAAVALLASLTVTPLALGQSSPAAQAARLKRLQDQQAAVLARVKAAQAASSAAAAQPTATPTVVPLPTPTAVPTAATTGTVAPKPSATAAATASASGKPATSASAAPVTSATVSAAPVPVALALDIEALRKTRADRRHVEFTTLQARWGALLSDPRAAGELKLHAQRSAYLQRIRALGSKDTAFVTGVDALITKEDTRDADAMNALRTGALPAAPVAAAAAVPAAGATK